MGIKDKGSAFQFNILLLMGLWIMSVGLWDHLPDKIPIHFGAHGQPDRWTSRSFLAWFGIPLVSLGLTFLMSLVAQLMRRFPQYTNIPYRQVFLGLPEEDRGPVYDLLEACLYWTCACMNVIWIVFQIEIFRAANGSSQGLPLYVGVLSVSAIGLIFLINIRNYLSIIKFLKNYIP